MRLLLACFTPFFDSYVYHFPKFLVNVNRYIGPLTTVNLCTQSAILYTAHLLRFRKFVRICAHYLSPQKETMIIVLFYDNAV